MIALQHACFAISFWLAWIIAFATFLKVDAWQVWLLLATTELAVLPSLFFILACRKAGVPSKLNVKVSGYWGIAFYILLVGAHFFHRSPTRLACLGNHKELFRMEPSWSVGAAYSFPAEWNTFAEQFEEEFRSRGYEVERKEKSIDAYIPGVLGSETLTAWASVGRTKGKHWIVDGDMVDMDHSEGWITVETREPDFFPWWIAEMIP